MKAGTLIGILMLFSFSLGDTPEPVDPPRSPAAISAQERHDAAVKRAKVAYDQAVLMANRALVDDLDVAMHQAMNGGNADEVIRINAAKKQAELDLGRAVGGMDGDIKQSDSIWKYKSGVVVALRPDGTFADLQGGTWSAHGAQLTLKWRAGNSIDHFQMAPDRRTMMGTNNGGEQISATAAN